MSCARFAVQLFSVVQLSSSTLLLFCFRTERRHSIRFDAEKDGPFKADKAARLAGLGFLVLVTNVMHSTHLRRGDTAEDEALEHLRMLLLKPNMSSRKRQTEFY